MLLGPEEFTKGVLKGGKSLRDNVVLGFSDTIGKALVLMLEPIPILMLTRMHVLTGILAYLHLYSYLH